MNIPKELNGTVEDQETFKVAMEQIEDEIEEIQQKIKTLESNLMSAINDLHARVSLLEGGQNVE